MSKIREIIIIGLKFLVLAVTGRASFVDPSLRPMTHRSFLMGVTFGRSILVRALRILIHLQSSN